MELVTNDALYKKTYLPRCVISNELQHLMAAIMQEQVYMQKVGITIIFSSPFQTENVRRGQT